MNTGMSIHLRYELGRLLWKCDRRERSASRELPRTNGYWRIEMFQDAFAIKEFLARP